MYICIYVYKSKQLRIIAHHSKTHKPCACTGDGSEASDFPTSAASSWSKREVGERP